MARPLPLRFPASFPALAKWVASAVYYTPKQRIRQPRAVRRGPNEVTDMKDLAAMQSFERSRLDRSKLCSFDNETIEAPTAPLIHQEARFLYICEGHGVIRIQGHDVELRPNTLLSILPWQITAVTEVAEPLQYHLVIYNLTLTIWHGRCRRRREDNKQAKSAAFAALFRIFIFLQITVAFCGFCGTINAHLIILHERGIFHGICCK